MSTKVTDLEKFLDEIWLPYWPAHPDAGPRVSSAPWNSPQPENYQSGLKRMGRKRHTIDETVEQLRKHDGTEWHHMVIGRIANIGFHFPAYIQHPLVDYLKEQLGEQS